jgi:PAS domain S-box-containing protein
MRNALHQEKEFSEGLLEHAQAIVLVLDVHGRIIRYNPYLEDLTGIPHQQVKGKNWLETFVPERERERLSEVFQETVRSDTSAAVSSLVCPSGRERRISWSNKSLKNVRGRTVAVLSVGQDISKLNQAQQRALQSERLAGIGQMSTGLAHESRNALQRIQACAEMLELEVEGNEEAMDLVRRIKLAQDHMHRLFDEVRGYAAPVNLDRSDCRLGSIWREAWEILLPQWEGRIAELTEHASGTDLTFYGDHFRLVQLFRILFENSLAACSDPVRIDVTCTPAVLADTQAIRISVRDNGPGLNQEQREFIFEPFYTTKTKGTGLGMAIAQRIVDAHEGRIKVGDGSQSGAEIIITLPHTSPD